MLVSFWDKDKDGIHDVDEELSTYSDENGKFEFIGITVPVGERIVMKDKGEHNGVSYTGQLSAIITSTGVISPLTTLEAKYSFLNKEKIKELFNKNGLNLSTSIDSDPMENNNTNHIISTLIADTYLKIDDFSNIIDKNESTFGDIAQVVKNLIGVDITTTNIEDTVSLLDYIVQKVKEDGNLTELSNMKNNTTYRNSAKSSLQNRSDKTKPAKLQRINGSFTSKKSKLNSTLLNDTRLIFDREPKKDQLSILYFDLSSIPANNDLNWSVKKNLQSQI